MIYLAVDIGTKFIGFAVSDVCELYAFEREAVEIRNSGEIIAHIEKYYSECRAEKIVLGFAKNLDDTLSPMANLALVTAQKLREKNYNVILCDERFSSAFAERELANAGVKFSRNKKRVNSVAAACILQTYLDSMRITEYMEQEDDL